MNEICRVDDDDDDINRFNARMREKELEDPQKFKNSIGREKVKGRDGKTNHA